MNQSKPKQAYVIQYWLWHTKIIRTNQNNPKRFKCDITLLNRKKPNEAILTETQSNDSMLTVYELKNGTKISYQNKRQTAHTQTGSTYICIVSSD